MLVGQSIGPFAIDKEIGSGAMGTVYRAVYTKTGRPVAVKVIAPGLGDNERIQQRFEREADILKQLKHPNIVRLLATGKYHGSPFYAMEFIEGEALDAVLARKGRLTWEEVVQIGKQVCAALAHAHAHNVIHRDLKPSNLMMDKATGALKLTDFGIAKDTDQTGLTSANSTVGTAAYMSPEQCRGERDLTAKSDLYSLGIVFYELLTGRKPFYAENAMDMFIQHVQGAFERPSHIILDIPVWLDNLVCQCLEKKPEHRPADAQTVAQALDEVVQKVETLKSAGVETANAVMRKGRGADKAAAEALLSGKRRRKKKTKTYPDEASPRTKVFAALGLIALLGGVIALGVYGLRPASSEELFQKGEKLMKEAEAALEAGEYTTAGQKMYDAKDKYLERLAARVDDPYAPKAQQLLDLNRAATLYSKGHGWLLGEKKDWKRAKEAGFDQLLTDFPPGNRYAEKARAELEPFEAPALVEEIQKKADPADERQWKEARDKLALLFARYPTNAAVKKARRDFDWLVAYHEAAEKVRTSSTSLNHAELMAMDAIKAEEQPVADEEQPAKRAKVGELWRKLQQWGLQNGPDGKPNADQERYAPYVRLATTKLRALEKAQK
jgi:hypothetical protein